MDWRLRDKGTVVAFVLVLVLIPLAHAWSTVVGTGISAAEPASQPAATARQHSNGAAPYIDLVLCPIRNEPWSCAREQSGRLLTLLDAEVHAQWQKLKVEADRQLNATLEKRGYSASTLVTKEKPSTILKKIEIGTNFMKEYLAETMDGFLGREYEYNMHSTKNDEDRDEDEDNDNDGDVDAAADTDTDNADEDENEGESTGLLHANGSEKVSNGGISADDGLEFIEIDDAATGPNVGGQLKKPNFGGGNKRNKKKGQTSQPATVLLVQQAEHTVEHANAGGVTSFGGGHGGGGHGGGGHGGKPLKQKRKKRKKHQQQQHGISTVVVEEEPIGTGHLGLDLLDELVNADDVLGGGGKRKNKHPSKYGRSNGVTRGKKKKKKKALAKLVLLGTFLKAKIELLLKILGAHLQIKFFAIALIGLLINIARFWIDVKRGGAPQKVVYVEHAHHQHHYEDHGDDWGEQGGSYWKRSLQTDPTIDEDAATDSYQPRPQHDAHHLAYRSQWLQ